MSPARLIASLCCVLCCGSLALGQQSGGLRVVVVGADRAPLPGATVTLSHATGNVKTTSERTDARGTVEFPVLRPGAGYAVQVTFPGLGTVRRDGLRVAIGEVHTVSVVLSEELREEVRVTAERPVIDLEQTEGSTKFSDDFIGDLPVPGRFYQNVLTLAPGVQDADGDGNPNVHGSRSRDFQAIVNGVSNVDPLTGQWFSRINPNSIEELEVISHGAGVEYGRAQGGFAQIVQKQGSNLHEGVFEFYWQTSKLDGEGAADTSDLPPVDFDTIQPLLQISGPLRRDRLWYRVSYEQRNREEPINVLGGVAVYSNDTETRDAQLTWQVSPRNKLALQYRSDPLDDRNFGVSSLIPAESSLANHRVSDTFSLNWIAPYSSRVLVDTTFAWQDISVGVGPSVPGQLNDCVGGASQQFLERARCTNLETSRVSGSFPRQVVDHRQRFTLKSQATLYAGRWMGMQHQLKLGLAVENERYFRDQTLAADMTFHRVFQPGVDPFGEALVGLGIPTTDRVRATGTNWALYVEDQLKPSTNVTLTLGARVDREEIAAEGRASFDPAAELRAYEDHIAQATDIFHYATLIDEWPQFFTGYEGLDGFLDELQAVTCDGVEPDEIGNCKTKVVEAVNKQNQEALWSKRAAESVNLINTNVSPFVALAWSPGASGKTAFKVSAGRHYNNIPLVIPLQELEPARTEVEYHTNLVTGQAIVTGNIAPTIRVVTVDHDLRTPYQDELALSVEREVARETSLRVTWLRRAYRDQIQQVDLNGAPGDYGRCVTPKYPSPSFLVPSPGSGFLVFDGYTQQFYTDTDPGDGDGRDDDCAGLAVSQDTGFSNDPYGSDVVQVNRPDGYTDLYVQNPFWGGIFLIGNFNEIDYRAYVLELTRRQYRGWEMNGSYVWSKAVGDGEDFFQELLSDPSLRSLVRGFQAYDQRHVVKLNATTVTPWGIRLGVAASWQSGLPYSIVQQQQSFDILPPVSDNFGAEGARVRRLYPTGARNDQRNESYWNFDLKATRELQLGRRVHLQLSAEIFNLLNDGTYQIYNPFFQEGVQLNGLNEARSRFGRRWQLGMRVAF